MKSSTDPTCKPATDLTAPSQYIDSSPCVGRREFTGIYVCLVCRVFFEASVRRRKLRCLGVSHKDVPKNEGGGPSDAGGRRRLTDLAFLGGAPKACMRQPHMQKKTAGKRTFSQHNPRLCVCRAVFPLAPALVTPHPTLHTFNGTARTRTCTSPPPPPSSSSSSSCPPSSRHNNLIPLHKPLRNPLLLPTTTRPSWSASAARCVGQSADQGPDPCRFDP